MPYYDNLWHIDAHENIIIACLFDSLCKIENWEPVYQICYRLLSSREQRRPKCETDAATRDPGPDFITADLWPPNSPELNTVDCNISGVLQERIYRKTVKNWTLMNWICVWLKRGLASSKVSLIRQLTNDEFTLMHLSKPNESILNTCYDVLFHNCQ